MWLVQSILSLSLVTIAWSEYCQNCHSSPCGFYGRSDYEWCFTGAAGRDPENILEVIRSYGGAFNKKRCIGGRCPSELPCSNWLDGMDTIGGRRWPKLRGLTKSQCLERCRETSGCVGVVLIANDNDYKGSGVTGNCYRSDNLDDGEAWTTQWSRSKFTGFLNNCDRTINPGQQDSATERSGLIGVLEKWAPGGVNPGTIRNGQEGSATESSGVINLLDNWVPGGLKGLVRDLGLGGGSTTLSPTTTAVYHTDLADAGDTYLRQTYQICGKLPAGPSAELIVKDIGGKNSAPWMVSLGFYVETTYYHECGGSLITSKHVLTAAHCIANNLFHVDDWKVRLGDKNLNSKIDDKNVVELGMTRAIMHPNFRTTRKGDKQSLYFDVGVIVLDEDVDFADGFVPICLPKTPITDSSNLTNHALTIIGYGDQAIDGQKTVGEDFLVDTVAVRPKAECNNAHRNAGRQGERVKAALPELFIDSIFCADQDLNRKIGPCSGDSGSPAFQRIFKEGDRFVVQGIVSGTIECASDQYPNFYTLVASKDILPWIKKEIFDPTFDFPDDDLSDIPCFIDTDCPKDHGFVCSETGVCLKPTSTSSRYLDIASTECPVETPCLIRGSCHEPKCNRHGICWCSQFQRITRGAERSSLEENECNGRKCKDDCECPTCSPHCLKGKCERQQINGQSENLSQRNCTKYNFLPPNAADWDIPCRSEDDCPRDWFCSGRCYPPSSNPSGSSDNSLYVPIVSGLSHLSHSCLHCREVSLCPPVFPCSDGSRCHSPNCSPSDGGEGEPVFCWCDLFASRIKKTVPCLPWKSCEAIQQQVESARKLTGSERNVQFRKIQKTIRDKKCTMKDGKKGVSC